MVNMFMRAAVTLAISCGMATATPMRRQSSPTVVLDDGVFTGVSSGSVTSFLGIPFAQPPVGQLRFQLPQPLGPYNGTYDATASGPACPQQSESFPIPTDLTSTVVDLLMTLLDALATPLAASEDCLTLDVHVPANATADSQLPVVVWIFGGGFEDGSNTSNNGSIIVEASVALNQPVIWVGMNYRVNAFGFLASQEVKDAGVGNIGLQDQRQAMRWVQQYISAFGGDPTKVTIWGQSAGSISVSLHLLTNGGNPDGLFRAAFMESGSPMPVGDITLGQQYYDSLVNQTGCYGLSDTLDCLRGVPYDTLIDAINNTPNIDGYQSLDLAWMPRVDGVFLEADPQVLIQQGSVANVPFINGDCDDEGTIWSLSTVNITTDDQFFVWVKTYFLTNATDEEIYTLLKYYPADPTVGSPFNTTDANALTQQFKRIAAFQGDVIWQGPRRFLLQYRSGLQNTWSYLSKRFKWVPLLGSYHGSDVSNAYGPGDMTPYIIRFIANLDPNGDGAFEWPQYTNQSRNLLTFMDSAESSPIVITQDVFRVQPIAYLNSLMLKYPL